jgi:hypothetical protein
MNVIELLREQFNSHVDVREKRPGVLQLIAPLFHEDGDMMDVFLPRQQNLWADSSGSGSLPSV